MARNHTNGTQTQSWHTATVWSFQFSQLHMCLEHDVSNLMSHAIDTQGAILTVLAVKTGCKKHFLCILW